LTLACQHAAFVQSTVPAWPKWQRGWHENWLCWKRKDGGQLYPSPGFITGRSECFMIIAPLPLTQWHRWLISKVVACRIIGPALYPTFGPDALIT